MLSILIPVYNKNVVGLVKDLSKQCTLCGIDFQILVFDDKSTDDIRKKNSVVTTELGVNYVELSQNIGRAKIRNRLGKMARYKHSLFLDCDSTIIRSNFVANYIKEIGKSTIVFGGRIYQSEEPQNDELLLHWHYGSRVESQIAERRQRFPFLNFHSNNFLVNTEFFISILFDEDVVGYGYEDLLFAEEVQKNGGTILHIDNEVLHDGLETTDTFISKTQNAVYNLVRLNSVGKLSSVRLSKFYTKVQYNGFVPIVKKILDNREDSYRKNLFSKYPSMRKLSMLKLLYYIRYSHEMAEKSKI